MADPELAVMNLAGNRVLRVRGRVLQAPVIRYVNPQSGRAVTLVSVAHVAEHRYYRDVQALASDLEAAGAVVQYELIRHATDAEWAEASEDERAADGALARSIRGNGAAIAAYLGWTYQIDGLPPLPSWQNADMTDLGYIRLAGPQRLLADAREAEEARAAIGGERERVLGAGFALLMRAVALDRWRLTTRVAIRGAGGRAIEQLTVAGRSAHAVDALPPDRDAVMIWGADHRASIQAGLARLGFTRAGTRWLDVGRLPGGLAAARDIAAALWAIARQAGDPS